MRIKKNSIFRAVSLTAALTILLWQSQLVSAATLTTPRDYLNRQKAAQTTGIQHEIFFTTVGAVTGGAGNNVVRIDFPDGDNWCATAGSDLVVTGIANPSGATESATALPGTLAGSCEDTAPDSISVTGVDNLGATTKYGVRIADGSTAKLGSPSAGNNIKVTVTTNNGSTDVDTGTFALSFIADDQVVVTATVDPTLSVSLSGNTAALGTLSASSVNYRAVTSTVSTNAASGFISLVKYGATLTSGGDTIGGADGDVDPGTSEWGASTDDATSVDLATSNASPACSTSQQSQGGAANATALSTTFQAFASEGAAASSDVTTLCFLASTSATQAPGTYTSTVTLVTTAKF